MTGEQDLHEIIARLADFQESLKAIEEAARGYRDYLQHHGWDDHLSQHLAAAAFFGPVINQLGGKDE